MRSRQQRNSKPIMRLFNWLWRRGKRKQPPPISNAPVEDDSYGLNDANEATDMLTFRPLLYAFQFVALPEAVFQNHPELVGDMEGERSGTPLLHIRSKAHLHCIKAGLIDPRHEESDADLDAERELFKAVAVHPHKRNGYTVYVVTMPLPVSPPEAYFVAIVHKDDEPKAYMRESPSTRYFTLEKSHKRLPFLCECTRDGSHANYGEGPAPDMAAFVEAVFEQVTSEDL